VDETLAFVARQSGPGSSIVFDHIFSMKDMVASNDSDVKGRVEASLKTDTRMDDVKVASVNNGVVLLSGKPRTSPRSCAPSRTPIP
jgi:osmotically-inducible protein OsmY